MNLSLPLGLHIITFIINFAVTPFSVHRNQCECNFYSHYDHEQGLPSAPTSDCKSRPAGELSVI